jgi:hypothetical protein
MSDFPPNPYQANEPPTNALAPLSWVRVVLTLGGVALVGLAIMFVGSLITQEGAGVSREEAPISSLPDDATNISYHFMPVSPVMYYEFDTSPEGFAAWVASKAKHRKFAGPVVGKVTTQAYDYARRQAYPLEVADGLQYQWKENDRAEYLTYDKARGRAYNFSHTR